MSFFPARFDIHAQSLRLMHLVDIDTPDGAFGFIIGADAKFTDVTGKVWWGSQVISAEGLGFGIGGKAKASSLTLSFFDDPANPSGLVDEITALGADYVKGRPLTRYLQVFDTLEQMYAPVHAPRQVARMTMDHIAIRAPDDVVRTISVHLEGAFRVRNGARRLVYNTADHARQIGSANPSYEFIPTEPRTERSLLG